MSNPSCESTSLMSSSTSEPVGVCSSVSSASVSAPSDRSCCCPTSVCTVSVDGCPPITSSIEAAAVSVLLRIGDSGLDSSCGKLASWTACCASGYTSTIGRDEAKGYARACLVLSVLKRLSRIRSRSNSRVIASKCLVNPDTLLCGLSLDGTERGIRE